MDKKDDLYYMREALKLAWKGEGYTSPNPLVGAVVVKDGEVVGRGYHRYYGGPHAEVYALDEAGKQAEGATIYVNLEPCSHYGKTPPCSLKIIESGIRQVVIAMEDPNPRVSGRGIKQLQKAGILVKIGLLADEARELNESFIKYITSDYPFVYLKIAQTLDGFLATKTGESKWISNEKARLMGHRLRHKVDAILVGVGTILADNPSLTTRLPDDKGKDSIRIILDSRLETPLDARLLNQDSAARTILVIDEQLNTTRRNLYTNKKNIELLPMALDTKGRIPLKILLNKLHERGIGSILVEGGGRVNYSFLQENLIDKVYAFITPKVLGGNDGIASFTGEGPDSMVEVKKLRNIKYRILGDNILLSGKL